MRAAWKRSRRWCGIAVSGWLAFAVVASGCSGSGDLAGPNKTGADGATQGESGLAQDQPMLPNGKSAPGQGDARTGSESAEESQRADGIAPTPPEETEPPIINPEVDASEQPKSTFGVDVDTASYDFARRTIADGQLPDPGTVRPEEFTNAFRQDYPMPDDDGFTVTADGTRLPDWYTMNPSNSATEQLRLLRVGLQTRGESTATRPDAALTFVIDTSGSMAEPGRLDMVQDALHTLVDQLRPTDSVAIVAYNDEAQVLQEMTPVRERADLDAAIDRLRADGSTNLESGVTTGYEVARDGYQEGTTNRVILLSDGLANTGNTTAEPILEQVRDEAGKGIALLCVGVGSEYGDELMEQLADNGDGFAVYVSDQERARKLFVSTLPATLTVRALDAKTQVTFNPEVVDSYRLIGYENRALDDDDFRDDSVDGGEVGPGHSVTALYAVRLYEGSSVGTVAEARVRWQAPETGEAAEAAQTVDLADLSGDYTSAPDRLRVAHVASTFAELLRGRYHVLQDDTIVPPDGDTEFAALAAEAEELGQRTEDRDVLELANTIQQASDLSG